MTGVTTLPDLPRILLVYAYCPIVIINSNPYMLTCLRLDDKLHSHFEHATFL